ncbi:MAG: nucleotidyltransferase family protein [Acidobacteriaceae bacterium]|nr:nucleotidyltransferase family protein [Acidobacteriaceae bacterium]MBV9294884.1 nucleotidyltransferase family protein [Acidobacteriaceae bacterium]MBV9763343.1 nucleotidyltransferase family protein [Acidobacteriaceae bacterium]
MAEFRSPYDFIVQCLAASSGHTTEDLRHDIHDSRLDWEAIIQTANAEMVLPALCARIQDLGLTPDLPADISEFFLGVQELNRERNQQIISETIRIARLLNEIGIEPVVLKGAAYLLAGVYKDLSARFIGDLDLLLPASMLTKAVEVLANDGYVAGEVNFGHHYFPLRRQQEVWVELHHSLGGGTSRSILPAPEMLKNSISRDFDGARLRVPSPNDLVIHHVLHAQIHQAHSEGIWPTLRTVYDLVCLQNRFERAIDWTSIAQQFRVNRREGALAAHLLLCEEVLGMKKPIPIRKTVLFQLRWQHIKMLRRFPAVRRMDPLYLFSRFVITRARRFGNLLRIAAGRKYLLRTPFRASFYLHRMHELLRIFRAATAPPHASERSGAASEDVNQ